MPWKTTNSNSFMGNKDKTSMRYLISVVYEFTFPMDLTVDVLGKTDPCFYAGSKEHSQENKSKIFNHIINCKNF